DEAENQVQRACPGDACATALHLGEKVCVGQTDEQHRLPGLDAELLAARLVVVRLVGGTIGGHQESRRDSTMTARRTAVITGASAGIGEAFAEVFGAEGWNVVLIARREDRLRTLADRLHATHGITADVIVA